MDHLPFILTELLLVFGGAMAFAWWQFRDLKRERLKREARARSERGSTSPSPAPATDAQR